MPISCRQCGTQLPDEANYCLKCGRFVRGFPSCVIAIASAIGRVGKTTTAVNLAAYLASFGYRTLLVDLSPDASATGGLGIDSYRIKRSVYDVLVDEQVQPQQVIVEIENQPNLQLLPSKPDLYTVELQLPFKDRAEFQLKRVLNTIQNHFDVVLIDCPSLVGAWLTINAFVAADGVMLPLQCEYFALEGLQQLLNTIKLVKERGLNPQLGLFGVVLTMYDPRTKLAAEVVQEISDHFGNERFQQIIPRNIRLAEAPSYGVSILQHDPRSPGAVAYQALAEEVVNRLRWQSSAYSQRNTPGHASGQVSSARSANP